MINAAAAAGAAPTMCTHPKCQRLAATIVEDELELVALFLPINRHRERAAKFEQRRERKREEERK